MELGVRTMQLINDKATGNGRPDFKIDRTTWVKIAVLTNVMSITAALLLGMFLLRFYIR
jgi:hypothetical protein